MHVRVGRRAGGAAALGFLAVALVAACSNSSSGSTSSGGGLSGKITLDAPLTLSGPAAFAGDAEQQGMNLAIQEINSQHYLGSATLAAKYVDVGTANDQASTAVRGMVQGSNPAIVGFTIANQSLAVAPLAQQAKDPMVVANTGGDKTLTDAGDYIYQMDIGQYYYAQKMSDVLKSKGVTSTAIFYNNDVPAISDLYDAYKGGDMSKAGITIGTVVTLPSTATDTSAAATSLLSKNPDAIGILARGAAGTTLVKALRQAGYKGILWGQAGFAGGVAAAAAPVTNGLYFTANAAPGSSSASMNAFFSDFQKATGKQAYSFTAQGYDSVWLVARALKNANCSSRSCVQRGLTALMKTGYTGALGTVTFKNRNAVGPGAVLEIVNGKETFVK